MTLRRRQLVAGLAASLTGRVALAALPGTAVGCAAPNSSVEVAAVWSGSERVAFQQVLADYSSPVELVSTGDDINALLDARLAVDHPPDVAVLSQPGLVSDLVRHLRPLPGHLAVDLPAHWRDWAMLDGTLYGTWIKAAHESLFWYRPSGLAGHPAPTTMGELLELVRDLAAAGASPLAVPAADGWVLAGWFANALVAVPDGAAVYDRLAAREDVWRHGAVAAALSHLADFWTVRRAFPDGPRRALLTQFEQAVVDVAVTRRAVVTFGADFFGAVLQRFADAGHRVDELAVLPYPAAGGERPLVVGGDLAVAFHPRGVELVSWLARPGALRRWTDRRGYLSPWPTARYADRLGQLLADDLHHGPPPRYSLSDRISGDGGIGGPTMWRILQGFFGAVTAPGADRGSVVAEAVERLSAAARGRR